MSLDLTLCIVPKEIELLISKAKANKEYAEWVAFIPTILKNGALAEQGDPLVKEINRDVAALKKHYIYLDTEDHLEDSSRISSSLDFLLDAMIADSEYDISKQLLWKGGYAVCDECKAVQGLPVKLYGLPEINGINAFLKTVDEQKLIGYYDLEKMFQDGVYKPTDPEYKDELVNYFIKVKQFFANAMRRQLLVLKVID